jgi:ParB-like chromosome segregation protein Spo0J/N6-adenosine-specific RNA methylase IME4
MDALTKLSPKKPDEPIKRATDLKVRNVGLSGIACLPQRRAVRADVVEALVQSMRDVGLVNPITLRPREGGMGYYLIAGRHRYEAARKLKWESIATIVLEGIDAIDAELCEIDENLIRADLSPAEQAAHHARRKELYENRYPETKRGSAGGRAKNAKAESAKRQNVATHSYTKDAASKTGVAPKTVERAVSRGNEIPDVASLAGTSLDKGAELDALAKLTPERQAEVMEKAKNGEKISAKAELKKDARAVREAGLGKKIAAGNLVLPDKRYGIILADWPRKPWAYSDETGVDRSPANHYPVQEFGWAIDVLAPMISKLAAPDCMLAFWSTGASLVDDLEIMAEAGFVSLRPRGSDGRLLRDARGLFDRPAGGTYRSHLIWDKQVIGKGRWFRDRHELLLIGVCGKFPAPAPGTQSHSIFSERKAEHSTKPDFVAAEIERLWPNIPKIEMFRRGAPRPGWDAWGNDALVDEAAE